MSESLNVVIIPRPYLVEINYSLADKAYSSPSSLAKLRSYSHEVKPGVVHQGLTLSLLHIARHSRAVRERLPT
jgi:hypothetical protein